VVTGERHARLFAAPTGTTVPRWRLTNDPLV
jgi:hypothetical protein